MKDEPHSSELNDDQRNIILSHIKLRSLLGVIGIVLPAFLWLGSKIMRCDTEGSISAYYYTPMREVFIGLLGAMALFLITYRGYGKQKGEWVSDNTLTNTAGILAFVVALCPTSNEDPSNKMTYGYSLDNCYNEWPDSLLSLVTIDPEFTGKLHLVAAALFFFILGVMSLMRFGKTQRNPGEKWVHRISGAIIFLSLLLMAIYVVYANEKDSPGEASDVTGDFPVLFMLETIALWAFGVSWLVKGRELTMLAKSMWVRKVKGM